MKYNVFTCTMTYELCRLATEAGYATWIPMERVGIMRYPKGKAPFMDYVSRPIFPGYIYVPQEHLRDFMRWCPDKYHAQPLVIAFAGKAMATKDEHIRGRRYAVVDLTELHTHATAVSAISQVIRVEKQNQKPVAAAVDFKKGQKLIITGNLMEGTEVTFSRYKSDGTCRVRTEDGRVLLINREKLREK